VIPPKGNSEFVAAMENTLDVYKLPYNPENPVICMDESPKQLIEEVRNSIPQSIGNTEKYDYEYKRNGVCNIFIACEPLNGKRYTEITETKTKKDWAEFMENISDKYLSAKKITVVMDNFSTHTAGAFYETFEPAKAKSLLDRFDFVYTPKHGSWLNMAEIELNVLTGQCLNRRISDIETVRKEVRAWENTRNNKNSKINWQFNIEKARIKLRRLYPTLQS
jgi:transposase